MSISELDLSSRDKISWITAIALVIFHTLAVVALFYTTWQVVVLARYDITHATLECEYGRVNDECCEGEVVAPH